MDIMFNIVLIAFSVCYVVDMSGIIQKVNKWCWKCLFGENLAYNGWYIPVIGCSRCLTFWTVLFYSGIIADMGVIRSFGCASFFSYISPIVTLLQKRVIIFLSDCLTKRNAI